MFDTKQIEVVEGSPMIIARVHYGSTEERIEWLNNLLQRFLGILKANPVPEDKLGFAALMLFERIKLFVLFSKHRGFREEREWRLSMRQIGIVSRNSLLCSTIRSGLAVPTEAAI